MNIKIRGISSDFRDVNFKIFWGSMPSDPPREACAFGARWLALAAPIQNMLQGPCALPFPYVVTEGEVLNKLFLFNWFSV